MVIPWKRPVLKFGLMNLEKPEQGKTHGEKEQKGKKECHPE
jgi:hypothetical protein